MALQKAKKLNTRSTGSIALFIDTTDFANIRFAVINEALQNVRTKLYAAKHHEADRTLEWLQKFLSEKDNTQNISGFSELYVVSGPGSFTGIRVGVAMALGIGFAQTIPVRAIKKPDVPADLLKIFKSRTRKITENFNPDYGAEPNITLSKK